MADKWRCGQCGHEMAAFPEVVRHTCHLSPPDPQGDPDLPDWLVHGKCKKRIAELEADLKLADDANDIYERQLAEARAEVDRLKAELAERNEWTKVYQTTIENLREAFTQENARLREALEEIANLQHHQVVSGHDSWQQIARAALNPDVSDSAPRLRSAPEIGDQIDARRGEKR